MDQASFITTNCHQNSNMLFIQPSQSISALIQIIWQWLLMNELIKMVSFKKQNTQAAKKEGHYCRLSSYGRVAASFGQLPVFILGGHLHSSEHCYRMLYRGKPNYLISLFIATQYPLHPFQPTFQQRDDITTNQAYACHLHSSLSGHLDVLPLLRVPWTPTSTASKTSQL